MSRIIWLIFIVVLFSFRPAHQPHTFSNIILALTSVVIIEMKNVSLPAMNSELIPFYAVNGKNIFPFWVEFERIF